MAKAARKPKSTKDPRDTIINATLAVTARSGWQRLRLQDVAPEAGISLNDLLISFPSKYAIINAFQDRVDSEMLRDAESGENGSDARDRLFDLLMARFDALAPHKAAMAEIAKDSLGDPGALCFLPRMSRTMHRILEGAGIKSSGLSGLVKAKGLALIYADAFRVWLKDDTADQSKTMATLDKALRRAEAIVQRCGRSGFRSTDTQPAP